MFLLGTKNTATQEVVADGLINLGQVYRRYSKKNNCGSHTFTFNGSSISLNHSGIYHITAVLVGSAEAGDATVQLFENGVAVDGAVSTQTITTADTEIRTFVIDHFVLVDNACVLGKSTTVADSITLVNTGVAATFTNVVVNIDKVV